MNLMDTLRERLADGMPFGFCPWEDGDGILWGVALEVNLANFRVQLLGTLGEVTEEEGYEFASIARFDFGERYAERLRRLRRFSHSLPEEYEFVLDLAEVEEILTQVAKSGAVAQVQLLPDGVVSTVRVLSIEGEWVTMRDYDDLMQPYGLVAHRLSHITGIRAGTAYEEADEFVERAGR